MKENKFITVPAVTKSGKTLGKIRLNLSNVLYFREWVSEDINDKKTVAFLTGGKEIVIKMNPSKIDECIE